MTFPCCYFSSFARSSFKKCLSHIKFIYSHEPNFMITWGDCGQSFQKFNSFKLHIQRQHNSKNLGARPENDEDVKVEDDNVDVNSIDDEDHLEENDAEVEPKNFVDEMTRYLALFVLKTKEENQLRQRGNNALLDSTGDLVDGSLEHMKEQITTCLERNGVTVADIDGLSDILQKPYLLTQVRQPLINEYQQVQYSENNFNFVVSLSLICKG